MVAKVANAAPIAIPAITPPFGRCPVEDAPIGVLRIDDWVGEVLKLEVAALLCEDGTGEETEVEVELLPEMAVLALGWRLSVLPRVCEISVGWLLVGEVCTLVGVAGGEV